MILLHAETSGCLVLLRDTERMRWAKVIAHGVPAYAFGEDMEALHQEITNYCNIPLAAPPRWLTKKEAREGKLHSSVLLCFRTQQEADGVIKKGLLIGAV